MELLCLPTHTHSNTHTYRSPLQFTDFCPNLYALYLRFLQLIRLLHDLPERPRERRRSRRWRPPQESPCCNAPAESTRESRFTSPPFPFRPESKYLVQVLRLAFNLAPLPCAAQVDKCAPQPLSTATATAKSFTSVTVQGGPSKA